MLSNNTEPQIKPRGRRGKVGEVISGLRSSAHQAVVRVVIR
jgi:hypothetical protein